MGNSKQQAPAHTLGLIGDGDEADVLVAIERSFGVRFTDDELKRWNTAGDAHRELLAKLPVGAEGLCATSMAFYRLRQILAAHGRSPEKLTPATRLAPFMAIRPHALAKTLEREHGFRTSGFSMSWLGMVGCVGLIGGLLMLLMLLAPQLALKVSWPVGVAVLGLGLAALFLDRGSYGTMTVGDLAREIAKHNAAHFHGLGADSRPETIWRTLRELLTEETGVDPAAVTPDTRLLA